MTDLFHRAQPPPTYWYLLVELRNEADPTALMRIRNIINSYLRPKEQWLRTRIKKGVHEYRLTYIGGPIDRSIFETVHSEGSHDLIVKRGEKSCQD